MACAHPEYVERTPEGGWRVARTRVSLDSVVHLFLDGASVEEIVCQFPALSLEQAYGAITFYLRNREEIDDYLSTQQQRWDELRQKQAGRNDALLSRLRQTKASGTIPRKTA